MCNGLGKRVFAALLVLCTLGCATAVLAAPELRILLYHRVGDDRYPTTNVPIDGFRQQMQYLADEGYTVVFTREVETFLLEGKALPDKAVAIQFDDGFRTVYDNAFPILKEFNYSNGRCQSSPPTFHSKLEAACSGRV